MTRVSRSIAWKLAILTLISGCATTGENGSATLPGPGDTQAQSQQPPEAIYQATPDLTVQQRFRQALALLEAGNPGQAKAELQAYVDERPNSKIARDLLNQIELAADYFPTESFPVELESGESLSTLSKKYLGGVYKFYALARYNNIDVPKNIRIGQTIRIPMTEAAIAAREALANDAENPNTLPPVAESPPPLPEPEPQAPEPSPDSSPGPSQVLAQHVDAGNYEQAITAVENFPGELSKEDQQLAILAYLSGADELEAAGQNITAAKRFVSAATLLQATGEADRALSAYRSAVNLNPADVKTADAYATLRKDLANKYHREASKAFRAQELDTAISIWDRVLEIDENHANAQVYRAQALELKERLSTLNE